MRFFSTILATVLVPLVAVLPVTGQTLTPVAADITGALQVHVVAGTETANIQTGTHLAKPLTVEVKDAVDAPVANAAVIFRLPDSGPSGTFADGSVTLVVYTDAAGRANTGVIQWGNLPGALSLRVTAAKGTGHAGLLVAETLTGTVPAAAVAIAQPVSLQAPANSLPVTSVSVKPISTKPAPAKPMPVKPGVLASNAAGTPGVVIEHASSSPHRSRKPQPVTDDESDDDAPQPGSSPVTSARYTDDGSPDANVPIRHSSFSNQPQDDAAGVSVTRAGAGEAVPGNGHHLTKWLVVAAVAAGAGVALAMVRKSSGTSSSGVTIGAPSVSVGHP